MLEELAEFVRPEFPALADADNVAA
jgi:hypothetical protein